MNADGSALFLDESAREKEGDVLGPYQLMRRIGEGAMGRVFLARHQKLDRPVALKVLRVEHARNTALLQRFFQEAKAVNQINHQNIVEIFDFVEEVGPGGHPRVYCVMELLEGKNLTQLTAEHPLRLHRLLPLAMQLCRALAAAHAVGVIHRDIKPDNLFILNRPGRPEFLKVLDFGVAKRATPFGEKPLTATMEGAIVGTPTYMAPEQASGLATDGRADLYAVGTVLYEVLAGHPPFEAATFGKLVSQVIASPPPALPSRTPAGERIPAALRAVVLKCLAKKREDRYADMRALEEALLAVPTVAPNRFESWWQRTRPFRPSAALFAAAIVFAAVVVYASTAPAHSMKTPSLDRLAEDAAKPAATAASPHSATTVSLRIRSTPPGARVVRADTGAVLGTTPLALDVPRSNGQNLALRLDLDGHEAQETLVPLEHDGALELVLNAAHKRPSLRGSVVKQERVRFSRDAVVDPFAL